jgi:hypothetical protein
VVEDESLGELNEWDEMAHPWTGHNGYVGCGSGSVCCMCEL